MGGNVRRGDGAGEYVILRMGVVMGGGGGKWWKFLEGVRYDVSAGAI